ncbi:hypothetical protein A7K91_05055 [Paenibacillus oryzae]|uniref:Peptidase M1 membrane alanine aminopeptidase domain-containing protein n=1 Tax=Paenibacillus oryzae TaxID=1844972 RepID=A0A1A5YH99_9BACL|nr:hypothetical protein [Paenibacillus oryzae]OBR64949.1 hypothetical protein A7K91_05055 [Paenibacillus oryzae]
MRVVSLLRVEIRRLLLNRMTWFMSLLIISSPALGLTLYRPISSTAGSGYSTSISGTFIANPALAGAIAGAILLAVLTAMEFSRPARHRMNALTDAVISPFQGAVVRTISLLITAAVIQGLTLLAWLPFTLVQTGAIFQLDVYVSLYLAIMLPAMIFAVLMTASAYLLTYRMDLTLALFAFFALLSLTVWDENWLLRWINPSIYYVSDAFSTSRLLRYILWNRLLWGTILSSIWLLSCLSIRRYGKGLVRSATINVRKGYIPALSALLIVFGWMAYTGQPFLDHSKMELDSNSKRFLYSDEFVTISSIHVKAFPDFTRARQHGIAEYQLQNSSEKPQTIAFSINPGYSLSSASVNGNPAVFRDLHNDEENRKTIEVDIPGDKEIEVTLEYGGFPQEWNILALRQGLDSQISRDYLYLANQDFAPIPRDLIWGSDEPNPYYIEVDLPSGMTPVVFGTETAQSVGKSSDGSIRWSIETNGASVILYGGDYMSRQIDAAGIQVDFWHSAKHNVLMNAFDADDVIRQVFQYCTSKYGPLQFYKDNKMRIIEIGSAGGGYASQGASVMGEDSFSARGFQDMRKGAGGNEVLAHEIIHQWWGLGNMFAQDDSERSWSSEGLTVYTTYRLMKEQYGEAYARENYVDKWQAEVDDYYQNFYIRNPAFLDKLPKAYRTRMDNGVAQMKQYSEMPLKLLKAEQLVGGEQKMDDILHALFNREIDYASPFLTYQQFLDACGLTKEDLELG